MRGYSCRLNFLFIHAIDSMFEMMYLFQNENERLANEIQRDRTQPSIQEIVEDRPSVTKPRDSQNETCNEANTPSNNQPFVCGAAHVSRIFGFCFYLSDQH